MTTAFADSYYYLALANERDEGHTKTLRFGDSFRGQIITTEWILAEVGDALVQSCMRPAFLQVLHSAQNDATTTIIEANHDLFMRGVELFAERADKDWSLTDCISFVVMEMQGIREALTADRHFQQAGFTALLL
jgi:predicted nucleic acid-binding protein